MFAPSLGGQNRGRHPTKSEDGPAKTTAHQIQLAVTLGHQFNVGNEQPKTHDGEAVIRFNHSLKRNCKDLQTKAQVLRSKAGSL